MIGLAALLLSQTLIPEAKEPPRIAVSQLKADCIAGIGSDDAAMYRCTDAMLEYARPFAEGDPEKSACLTSDHGAASDLVWNWLAWLEQHPAPDEADAGASVAASILDRWPCGWSEG